MAHHDDGTDDYDSVNGIRSRHQRGVQDGRHIGNYLYPEQNRKDNNVNGILIFNEKIGHEKDFLNVESNIRAHAKAAF